MSIIEMLQGPQIVIIDGAMGTQLSAKGLEGGCIQNILHPEAVRAIHENYVRAGAQVLTTNTLTANRTILNAFSRGDSFAEINQKGVELARAAAGALPVLGNISSIGKLLQPYGSAEEEDVTKCFCEQAGILARNGVDGFIIETMMDLREAVCALRACRQISSLPVFVTLSFASIKSGGRTTMGNTVEECAETLEHEGADAIGLNCGNLDPMETATVVAGLCAQTKLPVIAQPNAGKPVMENGNIIFNLNPEEFAQGLMACVRQGARFIGGCCGTSPRHIEAAAAILKNTSRQNDSAC